MADDLASRVLARYKAREAAVYQEIAIGALERGVRTLAKNLEKLGLKTEVSVFRSGQGGEGARSYVELEVTGKYLDRDGEEDEASANMTFRAGGYGKLTDRDIGGTDGWRAMAAEGLKRILADLENQGWKKP